MKKTILLFIMCFGLFSCSKTEDQFDRERVKEESKENFPTQDIDPDHDWNMAGVGALKVTINQGSGEAYTVRVYTANPLNEQSGAKLMAKKEGVKDGESISLKFDMPASTKYVYVMLEDKIYNRSVKMVDMTEAAPSTYWGTLSKATRSVATRRGVISYDSPNDDDFYKELPAGVKPYPSSWTDKFSGSYYIENRTMNTLYYTTSSFTLFIKGNVSLTGQAGLPSGIKIYLLEGSTLNMPGQNGLNLYASPTIYIAKNATLKVSKIDGGGKKGIIYNRGTIEVSAGSINLNGACYLYNAGKLTVPEEELRVTDNSLCVNLMTMNVSKMMISSNGKVVNESGAELNVADRVDMTDPNNILENNGTFKSNKLIAANGWVYNGCRMVISDLVDFNGVKFVQDGDNYFEAGNANLKNSTTISLGTHALFYVRSSMKVAASKFNGVGDGKALVYVKGVCEYTQISPVTTYAGNLNVAYQAYLPENGSYKFEGNAEGIEVAQVDLGSPNGCGNNYTDNNGGTAGGVDTPQTYTYAFEDITTQGGDYDFNDIVLKVKTIPVDGKLEVTLVAAGATKDLEVYYNNSELLFGGEVHAAMGCQPGEMINTGGGVVGKEVVDRRIVWQEGYTLKQNGNFSIRDVKENMWVKLPSFDDTFKAGDVPYAILVPDDWDFPAERHRVDEKYPNFVEWAKDATKEGDWYIKK